MMGARRGRKRNQPTGAQDGKQKRAKQEEIQQSVEDKSSSAEHLQKAADSQTTDTVPPVDDGCSQDTQKNDSQQSVNTQGTNEESNRDGNNTEETHVSKTPEIGVGEHSEKGTGGDNGVPPQAKNHDNLEETLGESREACPKEVNSDRAVTPIDDGSDKVATPKDDGPRSPKEIGSDTPTNPKEFDSNKSEDPKEVESDEKKESLHNTESSTGQEPLMGENASNSQSKVGNDSAKEAAFEDETKTLRGDATTELKNEGPTDTTVQEPAPTDTTGAEPVRGLTQLSGKSKEEEQLNLATKAQKEQTEKETDSNNKETASDLNRISELPQEKLDKVDEAEPVRAATESSTASQTSAITESEPKQMTVNHEDTTQVIEPKQASLDTNRTASSESNQCVMPTAADTKQPEPPLDKAGSYSENIPVSKALLVSCGLLCEPIREKSDAQDYTKDNGMVSQLMDQGEKKNKFDVSESERQENEKLKFPEDISGNDSAFFDASAFEMDITESQLCAVADDVPDQQSRARAEVEETANRSRRDHEDIERKVNTVVESLLRLNELVKKTRQEMDAIRRRQQQLSGGYPRHKQKW